MKPDVTHFVAIQTQIARGDWEERACNRFAFNRLAWAYRAYVSLVEDLGLDRVRVLRYENGDVSFIQPSTLASPKRERGPAWRPVSRAMSVPRYRIAQETLDMYIA